MTRHDRLNAADIQRLTRRHAWSATGVADYPPLEPLVGQSRFFQRYRTFIHTVDHDADNFAHVLAVVAEWGRGKSRLGQELAAQINDCSKGWYVRTDGGGLENRKLFDQAAQDSYLALYIRYSQVASDYQNSDNWFGYGLYKALLPLATGAFDGSIQSRIAEQTLHRLTPAGFDPAELGARLELERGHGEEVLYEEPGLVVRLVQAAYDYLHGFGIRYVLVILDELETVAEAANFGLEDDPARRLDGQAIRLIGKAIKEEDPRRRLPWLRCVALCSPLLGQQLREIQSVARRFELVELEHNAFADVSDYVGQLKEQRRLGHDYPTGLVEAVYAMSGANFGWFNVIMANVDAVLDQFADAGKAAPLLGELFDAVIESSGRVAEHVLDRQAVLGIRTSDHELRALARDLLYGQLPQVLERCPPRTRELLNLRNEDDEPVASLYRTFPFDLFACRQALDEGKFRREKEEWLYPAVDQPLNLAVLLRNLRTFAINENRGDILLLPLARAEFKHLLSLLHDHPAVEYAADALWQKLVGAEQFIPEAEATHIGPSVAMLLRLDLRYRNQQRNTLIFRDPLEADAHAAAMKSFARDAGRHATRRPAARLTALMRLLDNNWRYDQPLLGNPGNLVIQTSPRGQGAGQRGGLLFCDALKLHPDNLAWFAWVNNRDELDRLHQFAASRHPEDGRFPTAAFTASTHLMEQYNRGDVSDKLKDDVLLCYLNPSETDQLEQIGLPLERCEGFRLEEAALASKFKARLVSLRDFLLQSMHQWRGRLNARGLIVWPLRPTGRINQRDRDLLLQAWRLFAVLKPNLSGLMDLDAGPGHTAPALDAEDAAALLPRLALPGKYLGLGYGQDDQAGLFVDLATPQQARARFPRFLARIANPARNREWTLAQAKRDWYWGYLSHAGLTPKNVFDDWMWWCSELHLLELADPAATQAMWRSTPRASLENAIAEAENWFDGSAADGYRATVAKLEGVFGTDRIAVLFAPLGKSPLGTETVEAHAQLQAARLAFDRLKAHEEALALVDPENLEHLTRELPSALAGRDEVLRRVARVRPTPVPRITLGNIHALRLDDAEQSLFQRIEQARLFAEYVDTAATTITARINTLIDDLRADTRDLDAFPRGLFTLSLQTVVNILDGALRQPGDGQTVITESTGGTETLLHALRTLQLDKAEQRLQLLAEEAGLNMDTGAQAGFAEIPGHILSTYRACKDRFLKVTAYLAGLTSRCSEAARMLDPVPADYARPEHFRIVADIGQKLVLIKDAFQDLADLAQEEREKIRPQAQKGQFKAIRDVPDRLFNPLQTQLNVAGGELGTIENAIKAHQEAQIGELNARYLPVLTPLFTARAQNPPQAVSLDEVAALSLLDLQTTLDAQRLRWEKQAEDLLAGTGMDYPAWEEAARDILDGRNPRLAPEILGMLESRGILRNRFMFVGEICGLP